MSKWSTIRNRLKESNRDLDAEFEQFLNESLSEESNTSPRSKSPDAKRRDYCQVQNTNSSSKQWWESSAEDESASKDVQNWFKTPVVREEDDIPENDELQSKESCLQEEASKKISNDENDKQKFPSDARISITMSKDSLDDGTKHDNDKLFDKKSKQVDDNDENYIDTSASATSSQSQKPAPMLGENKTSLNTETPGINTQQEIAEKLEFFKQLEDEKSNLDYGKLNEMLDQETSAVDLIRSDDPFQATGVEVGNSIFNATETAVELVTPSKEPAKPPLDKSSLKPSMLDKVLLMDSLDSTMGTAHREKIKQIRQKQIDVPVSEDINELQSGNNDDVDNKDDVINNDDDVINDNDYSESFESDVEEEKSEVVKTEFLNTSGAGELAALQQALEAAHLENTGDSAHPLGDTTESKAYVKETQEVILDHSSLKGGSDGLLIDPVLDVAMSKPLALSTLESKGHSSNISIPLFNKTLQLPPDMNGSAQVQSGFILSRSTGDTVKPILSHDDIFQTHQTVFPSGLSTGFELPAEREPPEYSATFKCQTENQPPGLFPDNIDNHGFSLQPAISTGETDVGVEEMYSKNVGAVKTGGVSTESAILGEVSSDEDTPPPESLSNIKSIVKKRKEAQSKGKPPSGKQIKMKNGSPQVVRRCASSEGYTRISCDKQSKRVNKRGVNGDCVVVDDRFGWKDRSGLRTSQDRKRGTQKSQKEKNKQAPKRLATKAIEQSSPSDLMASVESFANYLNTFVHREDHTSRIEIDGSEEDLGTSRISREQALRKEIEHWQSMWQDERNQKEKLIDDFAQKDREWNRREQTLNLQHKKEINDLKQKVFVLESRLKDVDNKKRTERARNIKSMSDEELRKLEKEIHDQDQLLTGYQQENEKLYDDLKQTQTKAKTAEAQMFKENQKLASEVAALKEKLERKEGVFEAKGAAALGAERIHQLHSQLKILKTNEQELKREMDTLEKDNRKLQREMKDLERERDEAVKRVNEAFGANSQTLQDLESNHTTEIQRLNRKIAWYVENQELLDKDAAMIKEKNEEIQELRELVDRLEAERGNINTEKDKKEKERVGDAKRIQDLERQVREMEQIIKRRYPNSIPALIYAASSAPGDGRLLKPEESPKKPSGPSYAFLENRVKKLNQELEECEEDWARRFRVLEQKYNAMQLDYENHVTELRHELEDEREKVKSYTHTRARTTSIEKELENLREKHERKTREYNTEIKNMREKHERKTLELNTEIKSLREHAKKNVATARKSGKTKSSKRETARLTELSKMDPDPKEIHENYEARLGSLHELCEQKDRMIEELRTTCSQLQHQRQETLVMKELAESRKAFQENSQKKLDVLGSENRHLREQLSQITVEMDQQRVRYQASLADVERIARQEREASHDELCSLKTQHRQEIETIKQDYNTQHSRSKLAELTNKIASLEIVIEKLKDKLAQSTETEAELASKKVHEEVLHQEIKQLKSDLKKAKQYHTPEMHHYSQLEDKIAAMESRYSQREHELQAIIQNLRTSADVEKDAVLGKWRELVRKKTEETERFRVELEGILSVLEELRQQGVVIPKNKIKHYV